MAAVKKQLDISVGNLIGSNIFNILGILGVTAMVKEIPVNDTVLSTDIFWVLSVTLIVFIFALHKQIIHRWKGFLLFAMYVLYIYLAQA
jgi:cation:H+ antiporter